jgi:hypothetical protein
VEAGLEDGVLLPPNQGGGEGPTVYCRAVGVRFLFGLRFLCVR